MRCWFRLAVDVFGVAWLSSVVGSDNDCGMSKKQNLFNGLRTASVFLVGAMLLAGCASNSPTAVEKAEQRAAAKAARTPYGKLIAEAAAYLVGLTEQDQLPGIHKREHGAIQSV